MDTLDNFYSLDFTKIDFEERKLSIENRYTIISGPAKSGKSYLIYDHLSRFKSEDYLYINFQDLKIHDLSFYNDLQKFIDENQIKIIALDNYDFSLTLPKCDSIIIASRNYQEKNYFTNIQLTPPDFEEFLLFDKHQNITTSFNFFLKYGNLIETIQKNEYHKHQHLQEHIKLLTQDSTELQCLKTILSNCGEIKSLHQLFSIIKKDIKISKDRFYKFFKELEESEIIYTVPKLNFPNAAKKIYSYNHALISEVNFKKNFSNIFTNMVYLELQKKYKNIYYSEQIDFYIEDTKTLVLTKPFFLGFQISSKILEFIEEYKIKNIQIITVSNETTIYIDNIESQVIPFYSWAVQ